MDIRIDFYGDQGLEITEYLDVNSLKVYKEKNKISYMPKTGPGIRWSPGMVEKEGWDYIDIMSESYENYRIDHQKLEYI